MAEQVITNKRLVDTEVSENQNGGRAIKRQKSERTIVADTLEKIHLNTPEGGVDESDGIGGVTEHDGLCVELEGISGQVEDILRELTPDRIRPQIGPSPDDSEVFENNIHIRHPHYASEAIPLGIHLRKHKRGFLVHRIISNGKMADQKLKIGDVITYVGDMDTSSIELTDLKKLFWDIDAEVTFTLEIIRLIGDETDRGTDPMYQVLEIQVTLSVNNGDVKLTTVVEERKGKEEKPCRCKTLSDSYLIWCRESNGEQYLCVEEDGTPKIKARQDKNDKSFFWREQRCNGKDSIPRYILLNVGRNKTLDQNDNNDVITVDKGLYEGNACSWDQRMIRKVPGYYIRSNAHEDYYWKVGTEGRLQFTSNEDERRKFYFEPKLRA